MDKHKDQKDPQEESLELIKHQLDLLIREHLLFTTEGDTIIDNIIVELTLIKLSGASDIGEIEIIDHYNRVLKETILTIYD